MSEKKKFDWMDFIKKVAIIAIPVALQNLLTTTGSMVDTMMVGSLGEINVAAVGLCGQFSSLMFSCYWGFVGGGMLFFSQYWGNKDHKGINRSYGMTLICLMTVTLIFTCLGALLPDFVLSLYTDKATIRQVGVPYLKIVALGYPFTVLSVCMSALLRSTERVRIPLVASIASVGTNMFLNWVLIFGNLGAPKLGLRGAAIATVFATIVNALVIVIAAFVTKFNYIFQINQHFKFDKEFIKLYLTKCFPIICNELFYGVGNMVINIVLGHQPEEVIAAVAVFRTIEGLVIGFFAGFSSAASVLVGKNVGAGKLRDAYDRAVRLIYMCQAVILLLVAAIFALNKPILTLMSLSGESLRVGTGLILIYGIACIIRMGNWSMNDTYRTAGDATFGTVMEIAFLYLMVLPAILIAWKKFNAPIFVIFALCYVDEPIRYVLMQIHLFSGKWIRPVTPEGIEELGRFLESLRLQKKRK